MKTFVNKLGLIILAVIVLTGCSKEIEDLTGSIFGKITDAETTEPIRGATVTITPGGKSATTGADGTFEFQQLDPDQYEIQVSKTGYQTNTKRITVVSGRSASGDLALSTIVENAKLKLSVSSLNFGKTNSSLSFDIKNEGNAPFNWNISGLNGIEWLSIAPTTGTIQAGRSYAVTVTLLRENLNEDNEATITVNADNESVALKITAEIETLATKIQLSSRTLDFGQEYTSLTFDIKNIGNSGNVTWTLSDPGVDWLQITPMQGVTAMGKSSAIIVDLDRTKFTGDVSTNILVNADGESMAVAVKAEENTGGGTPGGSDNKELVKVVANGLYAFYAFEDDTKDLTETELNATPVDGPTYVESFNGTKAISFSRTAKSSISIPEGLIDNKNTSISFWIKDVADGHIFSVRANSSSDWQTTGFILQMTNNKLRFIHNAYDYGYYYNNNTFTPYFNHSNIADENWHHITLTSEANAQDDLNTRLYIDGEYVDAISVRCGTFNNGSRFLFGGLPNYNEYNLSAISMKIDNLRIYNTRAITREEVRQIYNAEKPQN